MYDIRTQTEQNNKKLPPCSNAHPLCVISVLLASVRKKLTNLTYQ